jgi:oligoribonuclease
MSMSEFIWLDLETTGLDPDRDIVLEFAAGIANDGPGGDFHAIEIVQSVITPYTFGGYSPALEAMDPFVRNMHTKNGLLAELERPELCCTIEEADEHLAALAPDGKPSLAGNSVHFDLAFIKKHMPRFAARLSHRVFDVSTLLRAERTYGDSHAAINVPASAHRAREDVLASLETARRFVGRRFR